MKKQKQHPLKFATKLVWVGMGVSLCVHAAATSFSARYHIMVDTQEDRCIPEYSVYLVKKNVDQIEKGHIYAFNAKGMEPYYPDSVMIGKYAVGIEGDTVVQNEQGVFINSTKLFDGYPALDKLDISASALYKEFVIKKDEIFFTGTAPRSYDSRYWGVAKTNQVVGEAIPLW